MIQIIKRLEIIKSSLSMEDMDIVEHQMQKLKTIPLDDPVLQIIRLLEIMEYAQATVAIDLYLKSFSQISVYEDPEIIGLRIDLKVQEEKVRDLNDQKIELQGTITEFKTAYYRILGGIMEQILRLKQAILEKIVQDNPEQQDEYEEAKTDYEEFHRTREENTKPSRKELNKADQESLKSLYRKCAKLCHPDVIDDSFKDEATQMFRELDDAYDNNDLDKITAIYNRLTKGDLFTASSDTERDREKLKNKIAELKEKAASLTAEIEAIKQDETYIELMGIGNRDEYFAQQKRDLEKVLMDLEILAGKLESGSRHV